jgi:hypothetical protein
MKLPISEIVKLERSYQADSLVGAIEQMLTAKEEAGSALTDEESVLLAIEAMEREVNNGGFDQFFINSSRRFAARLVTDLGRIGATKTQQVAQRVMAAVSIKSDTDLQTTDDPLQQCLDDEQVAHVLSSADSEYYGLEEDIAGLLLLFVKTNIERFV